MYPALCEILDSLIHISITDIKTEGSFIARLEVHRETKQEQGTQLAQKKQKKRKENKTTSCCETVFLKDDVEFYESP